MYKELKQIPIFDEVKYEFFQKKADDVIYRYDLLPPLLKNKFSKKFKNQSCLLDETVFDFSYIKQEMPMIYRNLLIIRDKSNIISFYYNKFVIRLMYKIMQILYTEENIYYFKFWDLKFKLKKRAKICDVWYQNDRIYVVLFKKIKFDFKFEYSKLE
jgi:hypothetical protein